MMRHGLDVCVFTIGKNFFTDFNTEYQKYIVKKKRKIGFLSVEERSTTDKNWKKVEFHGSSVFHFYVRVFYFIATVFLSD